MALCLKNASGGSDKKVMHVSRSFSPFPFFPHFAWFSVWHLLLPFMASPEGHVDASRFSVFSLDPATAVCSAQCTTVSQGYY